MCVSVITVWMFLIEIQDTGTGNREQDCRTVCFSFLIGRPSIE